MQKGTLYIFCGKMASGKSTLAKKVSERESSVLISEDVLLSQLYPNQVVDVATYVQYSENVKAAMGPLFIDLLDRGTSVVLDFPANTIDQRKWMANIVAQSGARSEFHYLNCSDAICKERLKMRVIREPDRQASDTEEMFDAITKYFEPPTTDEGFEIIYHERC